MANQIPLIEGTSTSGGTLIAPASYGRTLADAILRQSPTMAMTNVTRVSTNKELYSVYAGRPTAAFVNEAAAKQATGAEYREIAVNVKKIATVVLFTQELLDDAREDPTVLINTDVVGAFHDLIDAHMLGYAAGSQITTSFDGALRASTQTVEYVQANQDALATALSGAMALVEANGYTPNGAIFNNDVKQVIRNARTTTGSPLYQNTFTGGSGGFDNREPGSIYGLNLSFSSNLPTLQGTAAAGRVVGIVGDFSHALTVIRNDLLVSRSDQATVDVGGTLHHLWQQNKVALRWEMRLGFNTHDINRAFALILNAA